MTQPFDCWESSGELGRTRGPMRIGQLIESPRCVRGNPADSRDQETFALPDQQCYAPVVHSPSADGKMRGSPTPRSIRGAGSLPTY